MVNPIYTDTFDNNNILYNVSGICTNVLAKIAFDFITTENSV